MHKIAEHYSFYYECLMKANARSVLTAMRKCEGLTIETIATGHGPILREHVPVLMERYKDWSNTALAKAPASCAIFYTEGYVCHPYFLFVILDKNYKLPRIQYVTLIRWYIQVGLHTHKVECTSDMYEESY
jgi:hypothetical protein